MADFLTKLAERTLGTVPVAQPIIAPMFAPQPVTAPSALHETSFAIESEIESPAVQHVHQRTTSHDQRTPQPEALRSNTISQEPHRPEQSAVPGTDTSQKQHIVEESAIHTSAQQTVHSAEILPVSKPPLGTTTNHPMRSENAMPARNMGSRDEFQSSPLAQDAPVQAQHLDTALDVFHKQASTLPVQASISQHTTTPNEKSETQKSEIHSRRETLFPGETHASLVVQPSTQETLVYKEHTIDSAPSASLPTHQQATINGVLISHKNIDSVFHENDSIVSPRKSEETQLLAPSFATTPSIVPAFPPHAPEGPRTFLNSPLVPYTTLSLEQATFPAHSEQEAQQQERSPLQQNHQLLPNDLSGSSDRKQPQIAVSTHTYQTSKNLQTPGTEASEPIPTIHVTIGSIDVRAIMPSPSIPRPQTSKTSPTLSLQEYAKQRKGGER